MSLSLLGCASFDTTTDNRGSVLESGVFGNIGARSSKAPAGSAPQGLVPVDTSPGSSQIFMAGEGGGPTAYVEEPAEGADNSGSFKLNFENAEIKDVVHAVLGEALKLNYTLTPDVAGTITISSARPVGRSDLLAILETTLAAQGFAMVKTGEVYKIGPMIAGAGSVDRGTRAQPGYGVSVVPLRFVSVRTMGRLLGGFVIDAEGLRIDSTSNTMVIAGPGSKRDEVVRTILSFDEDWMQDQTVGIFELRRSNPGTVIPELERIFDSAGGGQGVITFRPINRLKSVMAISRNAALVKRAETWVQRLDQESTAAGQQVYLYKARNRNAEELAKIASSLFGGGGNINFGPNRSEAAADGGFELGEDAEGELGAEGEEPIDNLTGAGEDGEFADVSDEAPPDVLDLTTGGGSGTGPLRISADPANNTVIIYADAQGYRRVLVALQQLDVAPVQVAINVTIAEVRLNDQLKYGVQYFVRSGGSQEGSVSFRDAAGVLMEQVPGFNFLLGSDKDPDLILSALDEITDLEILSSPSLMVLENQTATLQVGDQIPVQVRARTSDSVNDDLITEFEYRDTGIILKVTPRVGDNGAVTMEIAQEISAVTSTSPNQNPTISRRRITSNISVDDRQTVVLAGLISTSKNRTQAGVPLLNRIAGIGEATANNAKGAFRNELIVLIRPQIVRSGEDAQSVAEDLRSRMWAIGQRERQAP